MNYPRWWNDTITVYNKYLDDDRIVHFKRTVIYNCFYSNSITTRDEQGDVLIPFNYGVRVRKDKNYISSSLWDKDSERFTFSSGDIIARGITYDEIDDSIKGQTTNDFLKKYKGISFTVKNVRENLKVDLAHYLVTGD